MTIPLQYKEDLYRFLWKEIKEKNCKLLRIGGIQNHIHLLIELHPATALSVLVRDLKSRSSGWMRKDSRFCNFRGWASEYFAATISYEHKDRVIEYIKDQEAHHRVCSPDDEFHELYKAAGHLYDEIDMR